MDQKGNNAINNYKGVMLCSRPNENVLAPVEKPFCGRVFNHQKIGLVPSLDSNKPQHGQEKKPKLQILNRHKKWLKDFQNYKTKQKEEKFIQIQVEEEKFKKIKEMAEEDRQRARKMRSDYNQTATNVLDILDDKKPQKVSVKPELTKQNLRRLDEINEKGQKQQAFKKKKKKGDKPVWAQTKQQNEQKQQQQVDELLDFFENTEMNQYSEDQQVKQILKNLKHKIDSLKENEDWREKEVNRIQKQKQQKHRERGDDDDKYSSFSVQSEAKSVASEQTQRKIQELRQKAKQQEEWDKFTATSKNSHTNFEEKIAKNLADEVLRNYPNLKGIHSNTSVRRMLQAQAAKAIHEPIPRPVITTVMKDKKPLDTNNLPYLHRNPAI